MEIKRNLGKMIELGVLLTAVSGLLVGCFGSGGGLGGGGGGGLIIPGTLTDGYVQNATVTLDVNDDRICSADEPTTTTDASGNFSFTAAQNPNGGQHMTCASGGTDLSTGLPLVGQLLAPPGATQITPLTNVVMAQVNSTLPPPVAGTVSPAPAASVSDASTKIATSLGLSSTDLLKTDPASAVGGNLVNSKLLAATAAVQVLLQQTTAAVATATTAPSTQTNNVYQNAANSIAAALSKLGVSSSPADALASVTTTVVQNTVTKTAASLTAAASGSVDTALIAAASAASSLSASNVGAYVGAAVATMVNNTATATTADNIGASSKSAQSNINVANSTLELASTLLNSTNNGNAALTTALATIGSNVASAIANNTSVLTAVNSNGSAITNAGVSAPTITTDLGSLRNVAQILSVAVNSANAINASGVLSASTDPVVGLQNIKLNLGAGNFAQGYVAPTTTDIAFTFADKNPQSQSKLTLLVKGLTVGVSSGKFTLTSTGATLYVYGLDSTGTIIPLVSSPAGLAITSTTGDGTTITLDLASVLNANSSFKPLVSLGNDYSVTAVISNIPLSVSATVAAGNSTIAIPAGIKPTVTGSSQALTVSVIDQLAQSITFGDIPTIAVNNTGSVLATASSKLSVTYSSLTTNTCTITGTTVTGVKAGTCTIAANQAGNTTYKAAAQATQTIVIGAAAQSITLTVPPLVLFGTTTATATATSNLPVAYSSKTSSVCTVNSSTGAILDLTAGTCTIAADQAGSSDFNAAPQKSASVFIEKGTQVVTFDPAPAIALLGTGTVKGTSSANPSLPITYSVPTTTSVCTVNASTGVVTDLTAGTCTVAANQAGNFNFNAAAQLTQDIVIAKAGQTIAFGAAPTVVYNGTGTVTASSGSSGNAVIFTSSTQNVCTVSGSTVTGVAPGPCTILADQAGNTSYTAATQKSLTFTIGKANQTITGLTFTPNSLTLGGTTTVSATQGASTSPVVYTSKTQAVCTVSGTTVTDLTAGPCTIAANQATDSNYNAAAEVTNSVSVGLVAQTISSITFTPNSLSVGSTSTATSTGGLSGNPVIFSSNSTGVCTVSGTNGSTITGVSVGRCSISANQTGNSSYNAANPVTQSLSVTAVAPGVPTSVTATPGNASAAVSFTAPASNGGSSITSYTVTSSPGNFTATGSVSPITVTGLSNGTAYTFTVKATNSVGSGNASNPSSAATPTAPLAYTTATSGTLGDGQGLYYTGAQVAQSVTFTVTVSGVGSTAKPFTVSGNSGTVTVNGVAVDPSITPPSNAVNVVDALAKNGDVIVVKLKTPLLAQANSNYLYTSVINFEDPTTGATVAPTLWIGVCTGAISGLAALPPSVPAGAPFPSVCP